MDLPICLASSLLAQVQFYAIDVFGFKPNFISQTRTTFVTAITH